MIEISWLNTYSDNFFLFKGLSFGKFFISQKKYLANFIILHFSIFHLAVTLIMQLWIMRKIEQMIGWIRMMIIYISSGCVGTLASAVLTPYQVEVGYMF